MIRNLKKYRH